MTMTISSLDIEQNAAIQTWFDVGGRADALAHPRSVEQVRICLDMDPELRVLGDGANLLVDDAGVGELVVSMAGALADWEIDATRGIVRAGAGANLPRLINETVRSGLAGLEGLAGIPATVGGALVMNAGGAFGQIGDVVMSVEGLSRSGESVHLKRAEIGFGYRSSGLAPLILVGATFQLMPVDPEKLRDRLLEVMAYKKGSQPMADKSAGCVFKNPTLGHPLPGIGEAGVRVSAGMLIDRSGCKGLSVGGASVSERHANFVVTRPGAAAKDVLTLMDTVRSRVWEAFGVGLEPEVVVWRRSMS